MQGSVPKLLVYYFIKNQNVTKQIISKTVFFFAYEIEMIYCITSDL